MPYQLNKTDGTLLTTLIDGKADTTSTNLTFFGKNYKGFGEGLNENFIKLLETFANSSAPNKPIKGQLWYDTSTGRLKVYNGTDFRSTDSSIISATQPSLVSGDLWIDNKNKQLYFFDGSNITLVGPNNTNSQGKSGQYIATLVDATGSNKVVIEEYINDSRVGIISKEAFDPFPVLQGFSNGLKIGYNPSSLFAFKFYGTSSSSLQLADEAGAVYTKDSFLSTNASTGNRTAQGQIHFSNDSGIIIGNDSDHKISLSGTTVIAENQIPGANYTIKLKNPSLGSYNAAVFDATNQRLGINTNTPLHTLDVTGNARITGNLIVDGTTTNLDVQNLRVEDKQIELGIQSDSTLPTDASVDNAGIVVRVQGDDKEFIWKLATDSWTSSRNIDLGANQVYKAETFEVLSKTTLGSTVVNSSLTSLGTLNNLQVDALNLNGSTITETSGGLQINSGGDINLITPRKITNVTNPVSNQDVATKNYVDIATSGGTLIMGLDITTLGTGLTLQANVATVIEEMIPANTKPNGTIVKIHTSAYSATVTQAFQSTNASNPGYLSKQFVAVDKNGVENQSVVEDFTISNAVSNAVFSIARTVMTYENESSTWTYKTTVASAL